MKNFKHLKDVDGYFEKMDDALNKFALEKRLAIEAEHLKRIKTTKYIRLYVVRNNNILKVFARVLNNYNGELKDDSLDFWELVGRVVIYSEDTHSINEWTKKDGAYAFLVKDATENMKICIKMKNNMKLFKVSHKIQNVLNITCESKPNIVKEFYRYVTFNNFLDHTNGQVNCDENLKEIFGVEHFDFNEIENMFSKELEFIDYCEINLKEDSKKEEKQDEAKKAKVDLENFVKMFDIEVECDDITQMPILFTPDIKMLSKKIEGNKMLEKRMRNTISMLEEFVENPIQMISKYLILEKDIMGIKTKYFEDLNIQSALFELLNAKKE